jgi:hypothetical protein
MMFRFISGLAIALPLVATPAAAATYLFGGANANNLTSVVKTLPNEPTLTVVARKFTPAPGLLTNLSQLATTGLIDRTASSIGVIGGANSQLDTNSPAAREAFLVSATSKLALTGIKLSQVDINDTLRIYGVGVGGALTALTGNGTIGDGLGGTATFVNNPALNLTQNGVTTLNFNTPLSAVWQFVITTRVGGDVTFGGDLGQGFRLDSLTAVAVPEPQTWAMMIAGFGLVGASMRRRKVTAVAA